MSEDIWKLGEEWLTQRETHPDRNWGFDQLRHNAMFWNQDIPESDRLHPEMAYQAMNISVILRKMYRLAQQLEPYIYKSSSHIAFSWQSW
jgi:hypothetical protein